MRGENKRGKVGRACAGCRKAHLRCDMKRPCERCVKRGLECIEAPLTKPPKASSSAPKTPKSTQKKRKEPSPETTPEESTSPIPTPTPVTREKKKRQVQTSSNTAPTATTTTTTTTATTTSTTQKKEDTNQACLQDKYFYDLHSYQNSLSEKMNQFYSLVGQKVSLESSKTLNIT